MKRYKIKWMLLLCWCCCGAMAQDNRDKAIAAIKQLTSAYSRANHLAFEVHYYYANENKPGIYLDSLRGNCKINGSRYWYELDSTEMLFDNRYVVILYKEDKLMYLAKPSAQLQSVNPLAMLDSFLLKTEDMQCSIDTKGSQKIITVDFKKPGPCKKIQYYIDGATGFLTRMVNIVKAEQLYDPSVRSQLDGTSSYAIVETLFSNYHENSFDDAVLDTTRYFTKDGDKYVTTALYTMYKIFLSNPGL